MKASVPDVLTNRLHVDTEMPKRNSSLPIQEAEESSTGTSGVIKQQEFHDIFMDNRDCQEEAEGEGVCPDDSRNENDSLVEVRTMNSDGPRNTGDEEEWMTPSKTVVVYLKKSKKVYIKYCM